MFKSLFHFCVLGGFALLFLIGCKPVDDCIDECLRIHDRGLEQCQDDYDECVYVRPSEWQDCRRYLKACEGVKDRYGQQCIEECGGNPSGHFMSAGDWIVGEALTLEVWPDEGNPMAVPLGTSVTLMPRWTDEQAWFEMPTRQDSPALWADYYDAYMWPFVGMGTVHFAYATSAEYVDMSEEMRQTRPEAPAEGPDLLPYDEVGWTLIGSCEVGELPFAWNPEGLTGLVILKYWVVPPEWDGGGGTWPPSVSPNPWGQTQVGHGAISIDPFPSGPPEG